MRMDSAASKAEAAAADAVYRPVKVFRMGELALCIFAHERLVEGFPVTFHSAIFASAGQDRHGKRRSARSFDLEDSPKLLWLAEQANAFLGNLQYPEPPCPLPGR